MKINSNLNTNRHSNIILVSGNLNLNKLALRIKYTAILVMQYNWDEIRSHNKEDDCWLVVKNRVYDVSDFLKKHPNHIKRILKKAGTDVTYDYKMHSSNQKKIWKDYLIGTVATNNTNKNSCIII